MSNVKVQGHPSGTGNLTIAAPNTNTDYTLNLPAASGTLLTNSGTEAGAFSTLSVNGNNISAQNSLGFRNRIINGDMRIDQRNAGASVSFAGGNFPVDRMRLSVNNGGSATANVQQNLNSLTPPSGFTNYIGMTVTNGTSMGSSEGWRITQRIEGNNVADLGWGTAGASAVTLSFWVRSNLTGTFGGFLQNSAGNRTYLFSYTISSANTWEYKTIVVAGDTSGTWLNTNGIGILLSFSVGCGTSVQGTPGTWGATALDSATGQVNVMATNSNTFYITGVQLEAGSVATPFERRPYGTELALCQRYYWKFENSGGLYTNFGTGYVNVATEAYFVASLKQTMRAMPSMSTTGTAANYEVLGGSNLRVTAASVPALDTNNSSVNQVFYSMQVASGLTAGQGCMLRANNNTSAFLAFSAEL